MGKRHLGDRNYNKGKFLIGLVVQYVGNCWMEKCDAFKFGQWNTFNVGFRRKDTSDARDSPAFVEHEEKGNY